MMDLEARRAALAGTREFIHEKEFSALVGALVDCDAVPRDFMAATLSRLADGMTATARLETENGWEIYPAELHSRAATLREAAAALRMGR